MIPSHVIARHWATVMNPLGIGVSVDAMTEAPIEDVSVVMMRVPSGSFDGGAVARVSERYHGTPLVCIVDSSVVLGDLPDLASLPDGSSIISCGPVMAARDSVRVVDMGAAIASYVFPSGRNPTKRVRKPNGISVVDLLGQMTQDFAERLSEWSPLFDITVFSRSGLSIPGCTTVSSVDGDEMPLDMYFIPVPSYLGRPSLADVICGTRCASTMMTPPYLDFSYGVRVSGAFDVMDAMERDDGRARSIQHMAASNLRSSSASRFRRELMNSVGFAISETRRVDPITGW
ncbi:hypothetical protein [uncultured Bifidobacterium sp.]|uniref:hypothetical protein n=1 Tax=uncultured Bifidobacterium sp. TaxID=165187 RepID=UPI0025964645|nr:hypothetical protein [uncultured Bifidobacterium sp.]